MLSMAVMAMGGIAGSPLRALEELSESDKKTPGRWLAQRLGYSDPDLYACREKRFAAQYGCEPKQTGRTTAMLLEVVCDARQGKRVVVACGTINQVEKMSTEVRSMARRAGFGDWEGNRGNVTVPNGNGEIAFVLTRGSLRGVPDGFDRVYQDHYDPRPSLPGYCLHRVAQDAKVCVHCKQKLAGPKLKRARVRRALVRDDPATARKLGLL